MPTNAGPAEVESLTCKTLLRKNPLKSFCVPLNTSSKPPGWDKKEHLP